MTYFTQQDLIDRFGETELIQLTDRTGLNAIDSAILAQAIQDASAEIDGYLAGVYPLPLAATPPQLIRVGCDMGRYYLRLAIGVVPETVEKRYEHAIKYLKAVATGAISLGVAQEDAPAGTVSQTGPAPIFDANRTNWP